MNLDYRCGQCGFLWHGSDSDDRSCPMCKQEEQQAEIERLEAKRNRHFGDCTIYSAMMNGRCFDGICTCGYGWMLVGQADWSEMLSEERKAAEAASREEK